jgi:hypothetical protein
MLNALQRGLQTSTMCALNMVWLQSRAFVMVCYMVHVPLNALLHDAHAFITVTWLIALLKQQLLMARCRHADCAAMWIEKKHHLCPQLCGFHQSLSLMPLNELPHDAHAFITGRWLTALLKQQLLMARCRQCRQAEACCHLVCKEASCVPQVCGFTGSQLSAPGNQPACNCVFWVTTASEALRSQGMFAVHDAELVLPMLPMLHGMWMAVHATTGSCQSA